MGGRPVIAGIAPSPEEQLGIIDKYGSTVLFGSVAHIYRITQETKHRHDLKRKGIKALFVTSECLSEVVRRQMGNAWNCDVHEHYGLTEMGLGVAVECHAHNGFHYNEADLLVEVVDPESGEALGDDEEGELVFTTLSRQAMPLLRYRTHDISRLISRPCKCGAATLKKIAKVTRRLEAIVKISNGDEIYPSLFDDCLFNIAEVTDYQLILGKEGDKDSLLFKVEVTSKSEAIQAAINSALSSHPTIRKNREANSLALPKVELVDKGTLTRFTSAKKLIVDQR
jgi:phenylacetate-CoA ligase